jgi:predicted transcriptional regulator
MVPTDALDKQTRSRTAQWATAGTKDGVLTQSKELKKHTVDRSMSPALIRALDHQIRRQALRLFTKREPEWSPVELTRKMPVTLSAVSYHMRVLSELGVVEETRTEQVRGSDQHFYISNIQNNKLAHSILARTRDDDEEILGSSG